MDRLWRPWRLAYVQGGTSGDQTCFLCAPDQHEYVVARGEESYALLNRYPYNTGHILVAPYAHVAELHEAPPEVWTLVSRCVEAVKAAMAPDGFNIGVNLGRAAGAGVPGHLHVHVVPRWSGDTNFMTTTGDTKVLPELLEDTCHKLRAAISS